MRAVFLQNSAKCLRLRRFILSLWRFVFFLVFVGRYICAFEETRAAAAPGLNSFSLFFFVAPYIAFLNPEITDWLLFLTLVWALSTF